jgi:hypothetical protein
MTPLVIKAIREACGLSQQEAARVFGSTNNPPKSFGFTVSPGPASGDFRIDVSTPENLSKPASFALTGTLSGTATLVSSTPWTSRALDAYRGISASPNNPIVAAQIQYYSV